MNSPSCLNRTALEDGKIKILLIAVCAWLLPSHQAFGLDPAKSIFQYNVQNWTRQYGLPANKINAITQTADGYIWLGTQNGLVRFDGNEFKTLPINLPEKFGQDVTNLSKAKDRGLWFAMRGGGFGYFDGEHFRAVGDDLWKTPGTDANVILEAQDGSWWTGAGRGLAHWKGNTVVHTYFAETRSEGVLTKAATIVLSECQDSSGGIWVGTVESGLYYTEGDQLLKITDDELAKHNIFGVAVGKDGLIWISTEMGLRSYDPKKKVNSTYPLTSETRTLLVDRQGTLWIGTSGRGLARYRNGELSYLTKMDGLCSDYITSLFEDAEGSIWVGTRDGLSQLTDIKFPIYSGKEGLIEASTHSVAVSKRGGIWIGTDLGFSYFDGRRAENYTDDKLFQNHYIKGIFEARNGDVYMTDGDKNICIFSNNTTVTRIPGNAWPETFAEDAESVLAGTGAQLMRIKNGKLEPYLFNGSTQPDLYWINTLCVDKDDAIWAATNHGIFRIKNGEFRQWSRADGLPDDRVQYIFHDDRGTTWAGMPTGIVRLKNDALVNIKEEDGLYDSRVYSIVPDNAGMFWVVSGHGIYKVAQAELNDFADGKITRIHCEPFNGLESIKFNDRTDQGFSGCKTADGRVWFPTPRGVVMIDPGHYFINRVPPPVQIQQVKTDGKEQDATKPCVVPVGHGGVEFAFTALSYISPQKLKIQYQLEGLDAGWVDAGARRSVLYNNLRAGRYVFKVQARNDDGVWNTLGAQYRLELLPPYYQTVWFYSICLAGAGLCFFGAFRWKVKHMEFLQAKLQGENDLLEGKVGERTKELATSVSLLNATLDSTTDGILALELSGKVICYNSKFAAMWKFPAEILARKDIPEIARYIDARINPAHRFLKVNSGAIAEQQEDICDLLELKDGQIFERYIYPQKIDGKSVGVVIVSRDITARRRAEAEVVYERDLLQELLDSIPDTLYFKDLQSRFVRVSRSKTNRNFPTLRAKYAAEHPNCAESDYPQHLQNGGEFLKWILGKTDFDLKSHEHAEASAKEELEIINTGRPVLGRLEQTILPNGSIVWHIVTKMPWRDKQGRIIGTYGTSKDITEIKEAEAKLDSLHKQLLETSRLAGMAEVATGVLHNVGNVLNSVNVSATVVADITRKSKISVLPKIASMIQEHQHDLAAFFSEDSKGKQLPAYIRSVGSECVSDQKLVVEELDNLRKNIEHIKEIVAMQQNFAKVSGVKETFALIDIVEDALRMNASALTRHQVRVVRDFEVKPTVSVERHKIMQVLVNLIGNAKHACDDSPSLEKKVVVKITRGEKRFRIAVEDNGVGIPAENLTRIFAHGFTTKKDGHGFGLHSGALAAKELGGSLTAQSDGLGKGATFVLELPSDIEVAAQKQLSN